MTVQDLDFSYPSKPTVTVLDKMNFEITENKVVALVGKSGCGKSSEIGVLERFYNPRAGMVSFDGDSITELEPHWYHSKLSLVQQEPVLFSGTLRENICYGLHDH